MNSQLPPPPPSLPPHREEEADSQAKWKILKVLGICLACGPIWGTIGTVIGMVQAFGDLAKSGDADAANLSASISTSLHSTAIGLGMLPIGITLIIISSRKLSESERPY